MTNGRSIVAQAWRLAPVALACLFAATAGPRRSAAEDPAPDPGPPAEGAKPTGAVYLAPAGGGTLKAGDLARHPSVRVVHTFADLRAAAGKRTSVWIDAAALPLGEKEQEWVIQAGGQGYPFALVGFGDPLYSFKDAAAVDWATQEVPPGFSVVRMDRKQVGVETHVSGVLRGYQGDPTAGAILKVTDRLLAGSDPDAP